MRSDDGGQRREVLYDLRRDPSDEIKIRRILIEGKETGIDKLDWILDEVAKLSLTDEAAITEEILRRVKQFNYVPTKKTGVYAEALMKEYRLHTSGGV